MMSMSSEVTCVDGGEGEIEKDSERDRHGEKARENPPPKKKKKWERRVHLTPNMCNCLTKMEASAAIFTVVAIATVFVAVLTFIFYDHVFSIKNIKVFVFHLYAHVCLRQASCYAQETQCREHLANFNNPPRSTQNNSKQMGFIEQRL